MTTTRRHRPGRTFAFFVLLALLLGFLRGDVAVLAPIIVLVGIVVAAKGSTSRSSSGSPELSGPRVVAPAELEAAVERLQGLALELALPGGRSRDEVVRDAAEVYARLPEHLREEIERRAPEGWFASGMPAPFGATPTPATQAATQAASPAPSTPAPAPASTPAPAVAATVPVEPVAGEDVRYSVLAPDELVGDPTTPPGSVVDGWYITSDRTRERWHNGSAWTAHVRVRGSR